MFRHNPARRIKLRRRQLTVQSPRIRRSRPLIKLPPSGDSASGLEDTKGRCASNHAPACRPDTHSRQIPKAAASVRPHPSGAYRAAQNPPRPAHRGKAPYRRPKTPNRHPHPVRKHPPGATAAPHPQYCYGSNPSHSDNAPARPHNSQRYAAPHRHGAPVPPPAPAPPPLPGLLFFSFSFISQNPRQTAQTNPSQTLRTIKPK
ncbi:Uncharacterised protein [Neisseria gonorrhoeae]|uniref:Uncharacterized protein n=1 Tax=Neisseria gonorrhoeae TaxID=485 RepID=A0A378VVM5_NEIGO|nr:Uncharacterised protein [Neisseria gonorrhoeae]